MSKTLREKLKQKREEIKRRASGGSSNLIFMKEGSYRFRILPVGDEKDWSAEIKQYYLGPEIKGVISPLTINEDCPIAEMRAKLVEAKGEANLELAKKLSPRTRYVIPVVVYEDETGKKVNEADSGKLLLVTSSVVDQLIEFFFEPDLGDFTDTKEGYDIKIRRSGSGLTDTSYMVTAMRPSKSPKGWDKEVDLPEMVRKLVPSYEEVEEKLAEYMAGFDMGDPDDDSGSDRKRIPKKTGTPNKPGIRKKKITK
jgi:hypothetical protein